MGFSVSDAIERITVARGHPIEREHYISHLGRNLAPFPKIMDGKDICRGRAEGDPLRRGTKRPSVDKGKDHSKRHGPARDSYRDGRDAFNIPSHSAHPWKPGRSPQPDSREREESFRRPSRSEFVNESQLAPGLQGHWGSAPVHQPSLYPVGTGIAAPLSGQFALEGRREYRDEGRHSTFLGFDPRVPPPQYPLQPDGHRPAHSEFIQEGVPMWAPAEPHRGYEERVPFDLSRPYVSRQSPPPGWHGPPSQGRYSPPRHRMSPPRARPVSPRYGDRYSAPRRMSPPRSGLSPNHRMSPPRGSRGLSPLPPPPRNFRTPPLPSRSSPSPGRRISPPRRYRSPSRDFRPPSPRGQSMSPSRSNYSIEPRMSPPRNHRMAPPPGHRSPQHLRRPSSPAPSREGLPPRPFHGRRSRSPFRRSSPPHSPGPRDKSHGRPDHLDMKYGPEIEPFPLERSPPRSAPQTIRNEQRGVNRSPNSSRTRRSRSPLHRRDSRPKRSLSPRKTSPSAGQPISPRAKPLPTTESSREGKTGPGKGRRSPSKPVSGSGKFEKDTGRGHPPERIRNRESPARYERNAPRQNRDWEEARDVKRHLEAEPPVSDYVDLRSRSPSPSNYSPTRHHDYHQDEAQVLLGTHEPREDLRRMRSITPERRDEPIGRVLRTPEPQDEPRRRGLRSPGPEREPRRGNRTTEPEVDHRRGRRTPEPEMEPRRGQRTTELEIDRRRGRRTPETRMEPRSRHRTPELEPELRHRTPESPVEPRSGLRTPDSLMEHRSGMRSPEPRLEQGRRGLRTPEPRQEGGRRRPRSPGPRSPGPRQEVGRQRLRTPEPDEERHRGGLRSPKRRLEEERHSLRSPEPQGEPRSRGLRTPDDLEGPGRRRLRTPESPRTGEFETFVPEDEPMDQEDDFRRHGVLRTPEPLEEPRRRGPPENSYERADYRDEHPRYNRGGRFQGNRRPYGNYRGRVRGRGRNLRGGQMRHQSHDDTTIKTLYLERSPQPLFNASPEGYQEFPNYRPRTRSPIIIEREVPVPEGHYIDEEPDCRELLIEKRISSVTEEMKALSPTALDLIGPDDEILYIGGSSSVNSRSSSIRRLPAASRLSPRLPSRYSPPPAPKIPVFERLDDKKPPVFERLDNPLPEHPRPLLKRPRSIESEANGQTQSFRGRAKTLHSSHNRPFGGVSSRPYSTFRGSHANRSSSRGMLSSRSGRFPSRGSQVHRGGLSRGGHLSGGKHLFRGSQPSRESLLSRGRQRSREFPDGSSLEHSEGSQPSRGSQKSQGSQPSQSLKRPKPQTPTRKTAQPAAKPGSSSQGVKTAPKSQPASQSTAKGVRRPVKTAQPTAQAGKPTKAVKTVKTVKTVKSGKLVSKTATKTVPRTTKESPPAKKTRGAPRGRR